MKIKKILSLALAALLAAGTFASCSSNETNGKAKSEKVITYATSTVWDSFNLYTTTNTNTHEVMEFLFDRLFDYNFDGTWQPRLGTSLTHNDDYTVYTVTLNENSKWHDGEPVTAADVVYSVQLQASAEAGWIAGVNKLYEGVDDNGVELSADSVGINAVDDYTVEFHLKQPVDETTFVYYFRPFVYPKHILGQYSDSEVASAPYWDNPIGSGPMKFVSAVSGERFELERWDDYYLGTVDFDRLVVRYMDASAITAGILSGEVDFTKSLVALDVSYLEGNGSYTVESLPSFSYQNLVINHSDPVFQDKRVREAIAHAVNRQAIVDNIYLGFATVINSIYPESHPYYDSSVVDNQYDPELAKQLLDEAGWDYNYVVQFKVPTGNESRLQSSLLIQQDLEAVGIKTEIVTYDFATVLQNMRDEDFEILLMGSEGSAVATSYTGALTYFSHTEDTDILTAIDNLTNEITDKEKQKYASEIQELMIDRAPLLFLYSPNSVLVYSNKISNINTKELNVNQSKRIWEWKVAD